MFRKKIVILSILILFKNLYASDIGCISSLKKDKEECSENNILKDNTFVLDTLLNEDKSKDKGSLVSKTNSKKVKITEKLNSITVIFQKKRLKIERVSNIGCPPYCISPINIAKVKTVGELETINFMNSFKKNRNRILVDARSASEYKKSTIPTAVNIPYSMLKPKSKYREEILKLLGVKKLQKSWYFKRVHKLLIFDSGILDNRATKIINSLIKIGYPQNKLLYYRGGIESWRRLGLTLL